VRQEKVTAAEADFLDAVERVYFSDSCRNAATAIAGEFTVGDQLRHVRLTLAIAAAQEGMRE
jgi:hypothetical protein